MSLPNNNTLSPQPTRPLARRNICLLLLTIICGGVLLIRFSRVPSPLPPVVKLNSASDSVAVTIEIARRAVMADLGSAEAWGTYGMCLYAHGFTEDAVSSLERAAQINAEDYRWPYLVGLCTTFTDPNRGRRCFERAAELRPDAAFVRLRAAEILLDLNLQNEAEEQIHAVLAVEPHHPRAILARARLAFLRGEIEESHRWAVQADELAPAIPASAELLAKICFRLGDEASARQYMNRVATQRADGADWPDPLFAQVMQLRKDPQWQLAEIQRQLDDGRTHLAISQLRTMLIEYPDFIEFRIELAQALLNLGDFLEATEILNEGLKSHPNSPRLHRMNGLLIFQQGDFEAASKEFSQAIELKPDYGLSYYNLGESFLKLGKTSMALREMDRALTLQPDLPGVSNRIAEIRNGDM